MPVHFFYLWDYLYVSEKLRHKGAMAGIITDMSKIKQVLIMHKNGTSNRQIAKAVELNKCTVNDYIQKSCKDSFTIDVCILDDAGPARWKMQDHGTGPYWASIFK
ncbi:MAG: hypothetical protein WC945_05655 [Bacteroidales bacterium]